MSFNLIRYCSINPVWTSPAALPLQDFCSLQWLPAHWHQSASRNRHGKFTLKQARRDCIAVYLHKRSTRIPHVMYILRKPWLSRSAFPRYDYIEHRLRCFICQPLDLCHRRVSSDKIIQPRNFKFPVLVLIMWFLLLPFFQKLYDCVSSQFGLQSQTRDSLFSVQTSHLGYSSWCIYTAAWFFYCGKRPRQRWHRPSSEIIPVISFARLLYEPILFCSSI